VNLGGRDEFERFLQHTQQLAFWYGSPWHEGIISARQDSPAHERERQQKKHAKRRAKPHIFIVGHAGYPFDVMVCVGATDEQVYRAVKKRGYDLNDEERANVSMHANARGRTCMLRGGATVLRLRCWCADPDDFGLLAHEIFHCVDMLFTKIRITLSRDSDEAYAYAIANLSQRILTELQKKRRKR
jgi:hypothetical protein